MSDKIVGDINFEELIKMADCHKSALNLLISWGLIRPPEKCECGNSLVTHNDVRFTTAMTSAAQIGHTGNLLV